MNYALPGTYAFKSNYLNNKSVRTDNGTGKRGAVRARCKISALNKRRSDNCEASGVFTCTSDMSPYTTASIFDAIGKATRIALRFGSVPGNSSSTENFCGQREFDIRFQTSNGDWDLMTGNITVQSRREQTQFVSLQQNFGDEAKARQVGAQWDIWSQTPESLLNVTRLYSDLETRYRPRCMDRFADRIYILTNSANERFYVKWFLMPRQGEQYMNGVQATGEARRNPAFGRYDCSQIMRRGKALRWMFMAQIVSETEALAWSHDPMDGTQVWDLLDFPLREVGEIYLDAMSTESAQDDLGDEFFAFNTVAGSKLAKQANVVDFYGARSEASHQQIIYVQLGNFYRQLNDQQRCNLITNMASSLRYAKSSVQEVVVEHLRCAILDFGYRMAAELELLAQVERAAPDNAYKHTRMLRLAEDGLTLVQSRCL